MTFLVEGPHMIKREAAEWVVWLFYPNTGWRK